MKNSIIGLNSIAIGLNSSKSNDSFLSGSSNASNGDLKGLSKQHLT